MLDSTMADQRFIREAAARTYWSMINSGRCPMCGDAMTPLKRGCCVYAMPCGHKLFMGSIGTGRALGLASRKRHKEETGSGGQVQALE